MCEYVRVSVVVLRTPMLPFVFVCLIVCFFLYPLQIPEEVCTANQVSATPKEQMIVSLWLVCFVSPSCIARVLLAEMTQRREAVL